MLTTAKKIAKSLGVDTRALYQKISAWSLEAAIREQGLALLHEKCREILPDVSDQYTEEFPAGEYERYWEIKLRGLHAFQVRCMLDAVGRIDREELVIADIGDSSGNHGRYLMRLVEPGKVARIISVNLDPKAVEKIKAKGGEAVLSRAEELRLERPVDLMMSFEMVEHLTDPARFLHGLATQCDCRLFLMTVPYRRRSRVALGPLRGGLVPDRLTAEDLHIFEFSPEDWLLLARFAGWRPVFTKRYLQYPRRSFLRLSASLWESLDFEGFFGAFFERDLSVAGRYRDW